ncbi:acyl-CoA dehydrogenase [Aliidiomarina minuta]|uniref:Acyl-CoA dehydrogenase n=1 Tax=Aliidiomarina minuta TaxID=880057 RepID=A0A432W757_9GAMM|nr:acyl-CoA dehydrogenase family protein [Aliidiomarina minuta]RUO25914.1 acyl-CoA dehydrogenase [Aliidiomarina minuta]
MHFEHNDKTRAYMEQLTAFMAEHVAPAEHGYHHRNQQHEHADWRRWEVQPVINELKIKAREQGLWNLFLPDAELGAGLTTVEYAPLAEIMGRSLIAPEIFNCNAPDTGNMEVLYHFGSDQQKQNWLVPLLAGDIRSVFCMTEPDVASSDATNMQATIKEEGDEIVVQGRKWWSTGVGHPDAKFAIVMGVSLPEAKKHAQHSMVIVPLDAPGVEIERMLPAFGSYDAPYGHGEVSFNQVRVPKANLIGELGAGFAIAQGRLGPGRVHHCMRALGAAEKALELMIRRGMQRQAFGQPLIKLGGNQERIAEHRMAIDQARLYTLYAADKIDRLGVKHAMSEISGIKVVVPNVLQRVVDDAIQLHGGAGLSQDVPLTALFTLARALRLADGPDEVHRAMVARTELRHYMKGEGA